MFQVTPFSAMRNIHTTNGAMKWTPCRIVGIDARDLQPKYIVEVAEAGEFFLTTVDLIRKAP
jgi:hypothetical protein